MKLVFKKGTKLKKRFPFLRGAFIFLTLNLIR